MKHRKKIFFLAILALIFIALFIFLGINKGNWDYALPKRSLKVLGIVLIGGSIAFSSIIFQTITNNRILTPSVLGLDWLYMFIQTFIVFLLGSTNIIVMNDNINFILSVGLMIIFSILLYKMLFKKEQKDIFFLLLVGLIFGTLFQSTSSFIQMLIDPNEFLVIQDKMFASFNNINTEILTISIITIILVIAYIYKYIKVFDVMSLGKEQAINLGVDYEKIVKRILIVVAILVSVSTALVGPITFLGILVVNLAYEFLKTYKHKYLIIGSILISIIALVGGQLIIERFINFDTTISVIINFVGGLYFIHLLLKEKNA